MSPASGIYHIQVEVIIRECKMILRVLGYHEATRRLGSFALATTPVSKLVRIIADTPILTIADQGRAGKAVSAVE